MYGVFVQVEGEISLPIELLNWGVLFSQDVLIDELKRGNAGVQ